MKKLLTSTLAAIGALTVVLVAGVVFWVTVINEKMPRSEQGWYRVERMIPSPSGAHVATHYTIIDDEEPELCLQVISVNSESEPFSLEVERKSHFRHQVFDAECGLTVIPQWESDEKLLVSLPKPHPEDGIYMSLKSRDRTGQVRVVPVFGG